MILRKEGKILNGIFREKVKEKRRKRKKRKIKNMIMRNRILKMKKSIRNIRNFL